MVTKKKPKPKPRQRAPGAGQPAKPTAMHKLHGTKPQGAQAAGAQEAQPDALTGDALTAPLWLDDYATDHWNRYAPRLAALGLLTEIDADLFAMACERYGFYRRGVDALAGVSLANMDNDDVRLASAAKAALDQCKGILIQFGIGPAGRTRIPVATDVDKPEDPAAAWVKRNAERMGGA